MARIFVYGTLRDRELLALVLGETPRCSVAHLHGHSVYRVRGESFPMLRVDRENSCEGLLIEDVSETQIARLNYYEGPYDYALVSREIESADGVVVAQVFSPPEAGLEAGGLWSLEDWQRDHGALMVEAAREIMARFGRDDAATIAAQMGVIRTRAASRLRAHDSQTPSNLRQGLDAGDVDLRAKSQAYANFFTLEELRLRHRKFAGEMAPEIERAVFVTADAVTVLPYDPAHDLVMLIEQFRPGPYLRGDPKPWCLEVIAGRIDPGETPEHAARREAEEETGLTLGDLHQVGAYYSTPGANTEYLTSYTAIADLADARAGIGGLAGEDEDIRSMIVPFDELIAAVSSGEAENAPLIISALWLARMREDLRSQARASG
jgi:nudix-type nucleoside diphosphatase (YffH/AdpP family)